MEYIVIGGTIYGEIRTTNGTTISLHYLFDENGNRIGFVVNGNDTYYYRFNLQGDVTGIYDAAGNRVAEYAYDAWGKLIDSDNTEIGNLNPIRYRGYYYDIETGFYYLQTRYYDPETGRFINADGLLSTGQGILGYNMFAYCMNNPVNGIDPCGSCFHHWKFWKACDKCKKKNSYEKFPIEKLKNDDGSFSLGDNRRFKPNSVYHEQVLRVKPTPISVNAKKGNENISAGIEADILTGGWEGDYVDLSLLDVGHAEASVNVSRKGVNVGALVSIWSPSLEVDCFIFTLTLSAEVGALGYRAKADDTGIKIGGAAGIGGFLEITWE